MRIRTITQVNSRWLDGRTYSAGEGTVSVVDDADVDAVGHMRYLAATGQVEILAEDPEPEPEPEEESAPETVDKIAEPVEVKDARVVPGDDLDEMRQHAQRLGLKVDRRWGADRLRQEILAAHAAQAVAE
jgi:hypothetical protein